MKYDNVSSHGQSLLLAGTITMALRLITGWTYFSAFWRRLILENKLDPDAAGYIGEKFNHFLPNALLIKPGIEYLVSNESVLWWFMLIFTVVEAIVGLLFMLGLFTRIMSIGVFALASGILLGAGWLGTTCLDEWQIGVLGIAAGFTIFLSGAGRYSLDYYISQRRFAGRWKSVFNKIGSECCKTSTQYLPRTALWGAVAIFFITLGTNQYFHGGVWGKLHNLSVRPHITITNASLQDDRLAFTVFRDEGADVYGSFLIGIRLIDDFGTTVWEAGAEELSKMNEEQIENHYVAKVKPGKHSLVIPLGARAALEFNNTALIQLSNGTYKIQLTDISGVQWDHKIVKQ